MTVDTFIKEKIVKFLEEIFLTAAGRDSIGEDESFLESGIIDSTGVLEFISFLEGSFQIQVSDEEIIPQNLDSISKVVSYLNRKLGNRIA